MKRKGFAFTLIELLVVLAILVILASLLIPKLIGASHKKEIIACAGNLKKLGAAFHLYVLENDGYAPFNENSTDVGDNFYSWEALYLLGPYIDDPDHKKFESGAWNTVRCPGNRSKYYRTGGAADDTGGGYNTGWQNRQAPKLWPATAVVPNKIPGSSCSPGEQIVDYQYNYSLGGSFKAFTIQDLVNNPFTVWYQDHPKNYKLNFVLQFPSEAVIFCDIHYSTVLRDPQAVPGVDNFVYAYPTGLQEIRRWGYRNLGEVPPSPEYFSGSKDAYIKKYVRTNERIHNGKGINAGFVDGHVEFLAGTTAYNGIQNLAIQDDLLNWGISYPICKKKDPAKELNGVEIPGIHGFRRRSNEISPAWCIEHEYKKGQGEEAAGACFNEGA